MSCCKVLDGRHWGLFSAPCSPTAGNDYQLMCQLCGHEAWKQEAGGQEAGGRRRCPDRSRGRFTEVIYNHGRS